MKYGLDGQIKSIIGWKIARKKPTLELESNQILDFKGQTDYQKLSYYDKVIPNLGWVWPNLFKMEKKTLL